jgi:hypothetical protein
MIAFWNLATLELVVLVVFLVDPVVWEAKEALVELNKMAKHLVAQEEMEEQGQMEDKAVWVVMEPQVKA